MNIFRPLVALIVAFTIVLFGGLTDAVAVTYTFELDVPEGYPVTDLLLYATDGNQDNVFLSPDVLQPSGVFQLTHPLEFNPTDALVLGITERDRDDKWDVIMFTNDAFASGVIGLSFGDVFPSTSNPRHGEMTLLLQAAHTGDTASLATLTDFLRGSDAAAAHFDPDGSFAILQWSVVEEPIGRDVSIPEPITATLGLMGLRLLGMATRRRAA
jgi:hypothetical protein